MAGYPLRDRVALTAALAGPLIVALILVPLRDTLSTTNMALILVVVIVAVAVDYVKQQLTDLLQLRACRFEYGSLLGHPLRLGQDGSVGAGRRHWEVDQRGWPDEDVELLAFGNGRFQGRFMLTPTPGARPPLQARLVAVTLADQVGNALDNPGPDLRER